MKKIVLFAIAALVMAGCGGPKAKTTEETKEEAKMMAREVPERADDFVFENNLIAGRIYGKALEGNPTSPGIDVWVKLPGSLVADKWYAEALKDGNYYHHDHGGKDCYKVGTSLGGGASVPYVDGKFCYPATNYRESEIICQDNEKLSFKLIYPEWDANGIKVKLEKTITVYPDTYFCKVEDCYTGKFDSLEIIAGVWRHEERNIGAEQSWSDRFAIWEHASDQSVEREDGMLGLAVYMPEAENCFVASDGRLNHSLCSKKVASGESLVYWFGSCWSKGDITTPEKWFELVSSLKNK